MAFFGVVENLLKIGLIPFFSIAGDDQNDVVDGRVKTVTIKKPEFFEFGNPIETGKNFNKVDGQFDVFSADNTSGLKDD